MTKIQKYYFRRAWNNKILLISFQNVILLTRSLAFMVFNVIHSKRKKRMEAVNVDSNNILSYQIRKHKRKKEKMLLNCLGVVVLLYLFCTSYVQLTLHTSDISCSETFNGSSLQKK